MQEYIYICMYIYYKHICLMCQMDRVSVISLVSSVALIASLSDHAHLQFLQL